MLRHITASRPVFLCCDIQEKFRPRIARFSEAVFVAKRFLAMHELFPEETRYIATQQYPKGLGALVPELGLSTVSSQARVNVLDKTLFSMITPEVQSVWSADTPSPENFVLFGIEAHACILQTADDLIRMGKSVYIAVDGTFSQRDEDRMYALQTVTNFVGPGKVYLTTSESILLALIRDAKDPKFKQVSALLQQERPGALGK